MFFYGHVNDTDGNACLYKSMYEYKVVFFTSARNIQNVGFANNFEDKGTDYACPGLFPMNEQRIFGEYKRGVACGVLYLGETFRSQIKDGVRRKTDLLITRIFHFLFYILTGKLHVQTDHSFE